MITQEIINRGGSKLEITRALLESRVDIPIPHSTWKYYGQSLESIIPEFQKMKKPVIVRGSHPNDYHGFIDVIPTYRDINNIQQLEEAVRNIEESILKEEIKIHCKDWKQPYSPEIHILIQEQSPSPIYGSMIRHPHKKELIVQYWDRNDEIRHDRMPASWAVSYPKNRYRLFHTSFIEPKAEDSEIKELVQIYEKLENCGILDSEWSQQVEFGLRPLLFYQARPFKKFQSSEDFMILSSYDLKYPNITSIECFGITPKEGIDLSFVIAERQDIEQDMEKFSELESYGLIIIDKLRKSPPIAKIFNGLIALCSPYSQNAYLIHGSYRLIKKSSFSFIDFHIHPVKPSKSELEEFRESRLFCNGKYGIIIPIKYL